MQSFTPPPRSAVAEAAKANFSSVNVRNLPKDISITDIQTLLEVHGLPTGHSKISILKYKRSNGADIDGLSAEVCLQLIDAVNDKFSEELDRKLYCSGMSDIATLDSSASKTVPSSPTAPTLKLDSNSLTSNIIPGLAQADRKSQVKHKHSRRNVTAVSTPGVGNNSRLGLEGSSSEGESETDSINSKTTKSKIKIYQDLVQREKRASNSYKQALKRNYDQLSPKEALRRQKTREGSTSSV